MAGLAYALSGSRAGSDELAQAAFRAAHRRWARISTAGDPGAWVRRTVAQGAGSRRRRSSAELRGRGRGSPRPDPLRSDAEAFWREVRSLPGPQALAVALHALEDLPVEGIALVLGCPTDAARVQLDRGRGALATALGPDAERLARSAASALWASVERLEPGIGDAVPEPRSYRTAALVTALALAAGAGAVGAAVLDDGRDTTQVVTSALEVPRLVPAVVPPGLGLVRAGELPSPLVAGPSGGASLRLYGAPGADDPFARLDLGIVVVPAENPVRARADDRATRSLIVRGQPGLLFEASDATGMRELQWTEPGGPTITLASRSLDDRQVLALAEGLNVEGAAVRPGPLPEGLELVANQPSASVPGRLTVPVPTIAKGWALAYGTPAGASVRRRSLEVATHRGDGDHLAALAWWYDGRTVEVRGHAGVLGTGGDGASVVSWLEDEGVAVTVSAVGFTEEELRGVARTLQRVGPTEWDGLERQAAGPP